MLPVETVTLWEGIHSALAQKGTGGVEKMVLLSIGTQHESWVLVTDQRTVSVFYPFNIKYRNSLQSRHL